MPSSQGPVEYRRAQGSGLRDERHPTGQRRGVCETGVDGGVRRHDAQAIGAYDTHAIEVGHHAAELLFELSARGARFTKAGREDHQAQDARLAALPHHVTHRACRCADDRQVRHLGQFGHARVALSAGNRVVVGVHRVHFASEPRIEQVLEHRVTDASRFATGTNYCDRLGTEDFFEVANWHGRLCLGPRALANLCPKCVAGSSAKLYGSAVSNRSHPWRCRYRLQSACRHLGKSGQPITGEFCNTPRHACVRIRAVYYGNWHSGRERAVIGRRPIIDYHTAALGRRDRNRD